MKKLTLLSFICVTLLFTACGNGDGNDNAVDSSSYNQSPTGPAPDNSNATNPSIGDTVQHADTATTPADTMHH